MRYWWEAVRTFSYWRYAIFSGEAVGKFFGALGVLYLLVDIADAFKVYTKDKYSHFGIFFLIIPTIIFVVFTRRPVSRVAYKVPKRDFMIEVKIGDLFDEASQIIISSNSTFDTSISNGLIAVNSLQGQLALKFFQGQTEEIDRQIEVSLAGENFVMNEKRPGKKKEYPIGTVAKVSAHGKHFYLVAMSHLNENGTACSNIKMLHDALDKLWTNLAKKAELGDLAIPLMGTGRRAVQRSLQSAI